MSISRTLIVTLNQDKATTEEKFFIYRDDVGIDIYIELSNLTYEFNKKKNNFKSANALFKTPSGEIYEIDNLSVREEKIKFSFTQDVVDKMQEIGKYELQFQLFDNSQNRVTIPSYYFDVKEPLETFKNEEGRVEYSRVGYAFVGKDDIDLFAIEDGYIKTVWNTGDLITASKLNNIEEGVEYLFSQIGNGGSSSDSQTIIKNSQRISRLESEVFAIKDDIFKTNSKIDNFKDELDKTNEEIIKNKEDIEWLKENGNSGGSNLDTEALIYKSTEPSTIDFGGIKTGYLPPEEGINILDLIDQAMHPYIYTPPKISFSINPSTTLYELGVVISNLILTANVTKGKEEITEVGILQSGALLETAKNSFSKTVSNIKTNTSFNAYVTDGKQRVNSSTISISFVNPIYIGSVTNVTEDEIKKMTKKIVNVSGQNYTYNIDTKRMCIAVPSGWNLKSVIDPNNFNITESFTKINLNITCLDGTVRPYTVYYSDFTSQTNFTVKFNF